MKNSSLKKSLKKSKNVLEQKRKTRQKNCKETHTYVYNNCFKLRSRAINNTHGLYWHEPFEHLMPH